jgi:hypothetical protein
MPNISSATTINSVQLTEQNTGAATPSAGYFRIYVSSTGSVLRAVDSAGNDYQFATGSVVDLSSQTFIVISTSSTLTGERYLAGTANRVTVTDGGAGNAVTLSAPQDLHTGATVQFAQANLTTSSASLHTGSIAVHQTVIATTASVSSAAGFGTGSVDTSASVLIVGQYYSVMVDDGTCSTTSLTINWTSGNEHKVILNSDTTASFSNPKTGGRYVLILKQDSTGSRLVTWPAAVLWPNGGGAPTLSTTGSKSDLFTFFYDGTNYYGNYSLTH